MVIGVDEYLLCVQLVTDLYKYEKWC